MPSKTKLSLTELLGDGLDVVEIACAGTTPRGPEIDKYDLACERFEGDRGTVFRADGKVRGFIVYGKADVLCVGVGATALNKRGARGGGTGEKLSLCVRFLVQSGENATFEQVDGGIGWGIDCSLMENLIGTLEKGVAVLLMIFEDEARGLEGIRPWLSPRARWRGRPRWQRKRLHREDGPYQSGGLQSAAGIRHSSALASLSALRALSRAEESWPRCRKSFDSWRAAITAGF